MELLEAESAAAELTTADDTKAGLVVTLGRAEDACVTEAETAGVIEDARTTDVVPAANVEDLTGTADEARAEALTEDDGAMIAEEVTALVVAALVDFTTKVEVATCVQGL